MLVDITAAKEAQAEDRARAGLRDSEARLKHHVCHDALTALPNRALLCDRLEQALPRGAGKTIRSRSCPSTSIASRSSTTPSAIRWATNYCEGLGGRLRDLLREGDTVARRGAMNSSCSCPACTRNATPRRWPHAPGTSG